MKREDSISEDAGNVNVIDLAEKKKDFMAIRAELRKCSDPVEIAETVARLRVETGLTKQTLDRCVKEIEKEKRDREREQRQQAKGSARSDALPGWMAQLLLNKEGEIKDCPANLVLIFENHPDWKGRIRKNLLTESTEIDGKPFNDDMLPEIARWLGVSLLVTARNLSHIYAVITKIGSDHGYHPIQDYLESLPPWDGTNRVDTLFSDFFGAEQSPYTAYVARSLLCSMVARAYTPGCIVRTVPILEGKENVGKSRFVRLLGEPWSKEISTSFDNQIAIAENIRGVWLGELMELDALSKADASRIKAFVTTTNDRHREPYQRVAADHPRMTVFVGTVNPNQAASQFKEEDENTRFLPLEVKELNAEAFIDAKPQLLAEAIVYLKDHPQDWWIMPADVHRAATEARGDRTEQDPWFYLVDSFLETRFTGEVTVPDVLEALDVPREKWSRSAATRVGFLLRQCGWTVSRSDYTSGRRIRVYLKSGDQLSYVQRRIVELDDGKSS